MEMKLPFQLTREKHLDHMVKVVPLIVLAYGLQSYLLMQFTSKIGMHSILFLGVCLVTMIGGFLVYDLKHQVMFEDDHMSIDFLFLHRKVAYMDIQSVEVLEGGQSFSHLKLRASGKTWTFYFIDEAAALKEFLATRNLEAIKEAA